MVLYITKYILCSGILLGFYHIMMEKESFNKAKRVYLLVSLFLPLLIPFAPTSIWQFAAKTYETTSDIKLQTELTLIPITETQDYSWLTISNGLWAIYLIVAFILSLKFVINIRIFYLKSKYSCTDYYKGNIIKLVDQKVLPHTFLRKIYINKSDYKSEAIDEKLMDHELSHSRQLHSLDIIIIEILKAMLWFNPFLNFYKRAIQLNHEFLADEAVLSNHRGVSNYQNLLFAIVKSNNNNIYLASNINFQLTKKRLMMMTKKTSNRKKIICATGLVPVLILMLVGFGNPISAQTTETKSDKDLYFQNSVVHYKDDDGRIKVIKYSHLSQDIKDRIPPPPPKPPNNFSSEKTASKLKNGTIVQLKENGSIIIGNSDHTDIELPLPPKPPMPPKPINADMPVAPPMPSAPPQPHVLLSLEEMIDGGATVYYNGEKIKPDVARSLSSDQDFGNLEIQMEEGKITIYINDEK